MSGEPECIRIAVVLILVALFNPPRERVCCPFLEADNPVIGVLRALLFPVDDFGPLADMD